MTNNFTDWLKCVLKHIMRDYYINENSIPAASLFVLGVCEGAKKLIVWYETHGKAFLIDSLR